MVRSSLKCKMRYRTSILQQKFECNSLLGRDLVSAVELVPLA